MVGCSRNERNQGLGEIHVATALMRLCWIEQSERDVDSTLASHHTLVRVLLFRRGMIYITGQTRPPNLESSIT